MMFGLRKWAIDYMRVWKPVDGYKESESLNNYLIRNRQTGKFLYIEENNDKVSYGDITLKMKKMQNGVRNIERDTLY